MLLATITQFGLIAHIIKCYAWTYLDKPQEDVRSLKQLGKQSYTISLYYYYRPNTGSVYTLPSASVERLEWLPLLMLLLLAGPAQTERAKIDDAVAPMLCYAYKKLTDGFSARRRAGLPRADC